jgi:hypothetical protein
MSGPLRPEILANDWVPPVALGRRREVDEVVRRLDPPRPRAPPPWIVGVSGPSGSGTSAVARRAAREVVDRLRAAAGDPVPRGWAVRVGVLRGTHGVATSLLRLYDDGFDGRGFPIAEIVAGFLRRVRREARPIVLVLDDLSGSEPDLAPIVRAFGDPDRFLPEGESGLPAIWTILAGTDEALRALDRRLVGRIPIGPFVELVPYDERMLASVVSDRAARALDRPAPLALTQRIVERAIEDGGGARRAIDLLRRELLRTSLSGIDRTVPDPARAGVAVEPRVIRAIGAASHGIAAPLGDVRRWERDLARTQGVRPLPTTTLWRRIVRLERAGYVKREIRTGGNGGTRSMIRVLTPIEEWITIPFPRESPRADARWDEGTLMPEAPASDPSPAVRLGWGPGPTAPSAG